MVNLRVVINFLAVLELNNVLTLAVHHFFVHLSVRHTFDFAPSGSTQPVVSGDFPSSSVSGSTPVPSPGKIGTY